MWPTPKDCSGSSGTGLPRSEEHTSELHSQSNLVCRLLLEKKNVEQAGVAVGAAGDADAAAVQDQEVGDVGPVLAGELRHQVALDLVRVGLLREGEEAAVPMELPSD